MKLCYYAIIVFSLLVLGIDVVMYLSPCHELTVINIIAFIFSCFLIIMSIYGLNKKQYMGKRNLLILSFVSSPYMWLAIVTVVSLALTPFLSIREFDSVDITNFYTAFIALCTTFVVGFQIYNSIELNKRIEDLNGKQKQLEEKWLKFNQLEEEEKHRREELMQELNSFRVTALENAYNNAYNNATTRYILAFSDKYMNDIRLCWNAIRSYFMALKYAAQGRPDFCKTIDVVGPKIIKCINELKKCKSMDYEQKRRIYAYGADYIDVINEVIFETKVKLEEIGKSKTVDSAKEYGRLVQRWNIFIATLDDCND